jgi:hypothetical protein
LQWFLRKHPRKDSNPICGPSKNKGQTKVVEKSDAESDADRAQNDDERALLKVWRGASESARRDLLQSLSACQETTELVE